MEGLQASISGSIAIEGDAVINNRKNKLIPAYELEIKGDWTGFISSSFFMTRFSDRALILSFELRRYTFKLIYSQLILQPVYS